MHNIISSTHVSAIFFWIFGRTSSAIREYPEVLSYYHFIYACCMYFTCIISSYVRMYLLFFSRCSDEPVRLRVSSLKYIFLGKIEYLPKLYTRIISPHARLYLQFSLGCSGETVQLRVSSLKYTHNEACMLIVQLMLMTLLIKLLKCLNIISPLSGYFHNRFSTNF